MNERGVMPANGEQVPYVRSKVARGEYQVDSYEVAAAVLERIGARTAGHQAATGRGGGHVLKRARTGLPAA